MPDDCVTQDLGRHFASRLEGVFRASAQMVDDPQDKAAIAMCGAACLIGWAAGLFAKADGARPEDLPVYLDGTIEAMRDLLVNGTEGPSHD